MFYIYRKSILKAEATTGGCRPHACNFIKIETLAQMFSCEFCKISKGTFFTEHVWATVSVKVVSSIYTQSKLSNGQRLSVLQSQVLILQDEIRSLKQK